MNAGRWPVEPTVANVCRIFGVTEGQLRGAERDSNEMTWARHVTWYVLRRYGRWTLEQLGAEFGRHHTTIHHGVGKVEQTIRVSAIEREAVMEVIGQHEGIEALIEMRSALGEALRVSAEVDRRLRDAVADVERTLQRLHVRGVA